MASSSFVNTGTGLAAVSLTVPGLNVPLIFPSLGPTLTTAHALDLETIDLEATRDLTIGCSVLRVSGGVRYLDMSQFYTAVVRGADVTLAALSYQQHFEGIGPTFGLEFGHDLGCSVSFYAHARGSVLFGNRNDQIQGTLLVPVVANVLVDSPHSDNMLSIGELGIGVEANLGSVFARLGYEGQIWRGAGGPTDGTADLGLHGFSVTTGVMF